MRNLATTALVDPLCPSSSVAYNQRPKSRTMRRWNSAPDRSDAKISISASDGQVVQYTSGNILAGSIVSEATKSTGETQATLLFGTLNTICRLLTSSARRRRNGTRSCVAILMERTRIIPRRDGISFADTLSARQCRGLGRRGREAR